MLALTTWTGGLLVALGVIAYVASGAASFTALIPTLIGVLLLIVALIGRRWDSARKPAMHTGLVIAVLAALGTLNNVIKLGDLFAGTAERPGAVITSTIMLVLLVAYLIAGVRSFVKARTSQGA